MIATLKEIQYRLQMWNSFKNPSQLQTEDRKIHEKKKKLPNTHITIQDNILFTINSNHEERRVMIPNILL